MKEETIKSVIPAEFCRLTNIRKERVSRNKTLFDWAEKIEGEKEQMILTAKNIEVAKFFAVKKLTKNTKSEMDQILEKFSK
jgi:tRNA(Ile)-lysidine synthase TilS/MesJ